MFILLDLADTPAGAKELTDLHLPGSYDFMVTFLLVIEILTVPRLNYQTRFLGGFRTVG